MLRVIFYKSQFSLPSFENNIFCRTWYSRNILRSWEFIIERNQIANAKMSNCVITNARLFHISFKRMIPIEYCKVNILRMSCKLFYDEGYRLKYKGYVLFKYILYITIFDTQLVAYKIESTPYIYFADNSKALWETFCQMILLSCFWYAVYV